jgi:hypothetical protein
VEGRVEGDLVVEEEVNNRKRRMEMKMRMEGWRV